MSNKKTIKYRVDFSAHYSIIVEVPDTEDAEYKAVEFAESYMENTGHALIGKWMTAELKKRIRMKNL